MNATSFAVSGSPSDLAQGEGEGQEIVGILIRFRQPVFRRAALQGVEDHQRLVHEIDDRRQHGRCVERVVIFDPGRQLLGHHGEDGAVVVLGLGQAGRQDQNAGKQRPFQESGRH